MRITPSPTPLGIDAATGAPRHYDIALVVVHGMGNAFKSQILLEWAEPILERIDWLTRDRMAGADDPDRFGVSVAQSDLSGEIPMVSAEVGVPLLPEEGKPAVRRTVRIAILEARWSESFVPMTRRQVFRWAVNFLWRAIWRMLLQVGRTIVVLPRLTMRSHASKVRTNGWMALVVPIDLIRFLGGLAVFIAYLAVVFGLGLVATVLLPLLSPLLLIPWFKERAQEVIDGIVESIGDVAVWKERPLRASAMRLVVRNALDEAANLVGVDPEYERERRTQMPEREPSPTGGPQDVSHGVVHVLAHSQGAALATYSLFSDGLAPSDYGVRRLTTVGAAVVLLGREKWKGRPDEYLPVTAWGKQQPEVAWENYWAIWDPFSAGPIADDAKSMRERWRDAYFPSSRRPGSRKRPTAQPACGPGEHAVHNTSQPFLDHTMYYDNTLQVVEPAARALLPKEFAGPGEQVRYVADRLLVIDKTSLGINMLLSIVIAITLPSLDWVSELLATFIDRAGRFIAQLLTLGMAEPGASPLSFLIEGDPPDLALTAWGWAVTTALLLALLIWWNQVLAGRTIRTLLWNRCPPNPWKWLVFSSIPRAAYTGVALWAVLNAILESRSASLKQAGTASVDDGWLWVAGISAVVAAALLFWEPFVTPVPTAVRSRIPASGSSDPSTGNAAVPESPRFTLRGAMTDGTPFRQEFEQRSEERTAALRKQDEADCGRADREGWWWNARRQWRRSFVRPVSDYFHR